MSVIQGTLLLLERVLVSLLVFTALSAAILLVPWSAANFVIRGGWPPFTPPAAAVRSWEDCLPRIFLVYTAVLLAASPNEVEPLSGNRRQSPWRSVLERLPVSDAMIRKHESPWRACPWLFVYGLLVFGLLEWHHGRRIWLSVLVVPLLALGQAAITLALAGIFKVFWRASVAATVAAIALIAMAMPLALYASIAPTEQFLAAWPGDPLFRIVPTGWILIVWRDGWMAGELLPWWVLGVCVVLWRAERCLVERWPIEVEEEATRRRRAWRFRTKRSVMETSRPDATRTLQRIRTVLQPGFPRPSRWAWRNCWLEWPLQRRDATIVASLNFYDGRPVGIGLLVALWTVAITLGRLLTFVSDHAYYSAAPDSLGILAAMSTAAYFGRISAGGLNTYVRLESIPLGYDETLRACFRLAVSYAKRFAPGQGVLLAILIVYDGISPIGAIGVTIAPLLIWCGFSPLLCQSAAYRQSSLATLFVFLVNAVLGVAALSLLCHSEQALSLIGCAATVCGVWAFNAVARLFYLNGCGEDHVRLF